MGIHREFDISKNDVPPIPIDPKAGTEKLTCHDAAGIEIIVWLTREEIEAHKQKYGENWVEKKYGIGAIVGKHYHEESYGEPVSRSPLKDIPGASLISDIQVARGASGKAISQTEFPRGGRSQNPRNREHVKAVKTASPPEKAEIDKVEERTHKSGLEVRLSGKNPKKKLLDNKVTKKPLPEDKPGGLPGEKLPFLKAETVISDLVTPLGFTDTYIEAIDSRLPLETEFKDLYIFEALDMICKMTGCNYFIDSYGNFHYFKPGTRIHPTVATINPVNLLSVGDFAVNPIQASTFCRIRDSQEQLNNAQVFCKEYSNPYTETHKADGSSSEYHLSYPPKFCTLTVAVIPVGIPHDTGVLWTKLDWDNRKQVTEKPIPSPDCGTPMMSVFGVYFNPKEKCIRFVDAATGLPLPPVEGDIINITYVYQQDVYMDLNNPASIQEWGKKQKIFFSPEGLDKSVMKQMVEQELKDFADPIEMVDFKVFDDVYTVGDTIRVINDLIGIDKYYTVWEVERTFDRDQAGSRKDPSWSVRIKAGSKLPVKLDDILFNHAQRIRNLERGFSPIDTATPDGVLVPDEKGQILFEEIEACDAVEFILFDAGDDRIDDARIEVNRIR